MVGNAGTRTGDDVAALEAFDLCSNLHNLTRSRIANRHTAIDAALYERDRPLHANISHHPERALGMLRLLEDPSVERQAGQLDTRHFSTDAHRWMMNLNKHILRPDRRRGNVLHEHAAALDENLLHDHTPRVSTIFLPVRLARSMWENCRWFTNRATIPARAIASDAVVMMTWFLPARSPGSS